MREWRITQLPVICVSHMALCSAWIFLHSTVNLHVHLVLAFSGKHFLPYIWEFLAPCFHDVHSLLCLHNTNLPDDVALTASFLIFV
jgi:hypothetical protein